MRARVDESYVHLRIRLAEPVPARLTIGLDVLPGLTGTPPPGSGDTRADAAFELDLAGFTGQAWLRTQLDPLPLDYTAPPGVRPAPRRRLAALPARGQPGPGHPVERAAAARPSSSTPGVLRYGSWDPADPTADEPGAVVAGRHRPRRTRAVGHGRVRRPVDAPGARAAGRAGDHREIVPGIGVTLSAAGDDQTIGEVRLADWQRPFHRERLKRGARAVRDAFVDTAGR